MSTTTQPGIITPAELLEHWQGHRSLTRRVINAFPEKELFHFSIGGMRTYATIAKELLTMAAPSIAQVVTGNIVSYEKQGNVPETKEQLLNAWDEATEQLNIYWPQIEEGRFRKNFNLYGQFDYPLIQNIQYLIDNEIHHRGQGYVYLRALNIEPPPFWDRPPFGK